MCHSRVSNHQDKYSHVGNNFGQKVCVISTVMRAFALALLASLSGASLPPRPLEKVAEYCVSSRWGFSCFDAARSEVFARAGRQAVRRFVGRSALASFGLVVGREILRDVNENRRLLVSSKGLAALEGPETAAMLGVQPQLEETPEESRASDGEAAEAEADADAAADAEAAPVDPQPADDAGTSTTVDADVSDVRAQQAVAPTAVARKELGQLASGRKGPRRSRVRVGG